MQNELVSITCDDTTVKMPEITAQANFIEINSLGDEEYEAILKYTKALQNQNEKIKEYRLEIANKANIKDIPTKNSQLENDSNFATIEQLPIAPTTLGELENDCDFATNASLEKMTSGKVNINADNFSENGKNKIVSLGLPDYSKTINLILPAAGQTWIVPHDCLLMITQYNISVGTILRHNDVNGAIIIYTASVTAQAVCSDKAYLQKGTVIYVGSNAYPYVSQITPLVGAG